MNEAKPALTGKPARKGKAVALSGLLVVQAGCAVFFLLDVMADLGAWNLVADGVLHTSIEVVAVVALILGIALTALEIRRIRTRQRPGGAF
jgi:hypothetical protein